MKNLSNKVTRRIAAMLLVLLINSAVQATNYYVDPSSTATSANGSLLYPWKTISQANAGTTLLNPGDSVFFKRGQLYSGRLVIQRSGVAGKPIVYTNYGTGSLPEFNNAVSDIINISNRQKAYSSDKSHKKIRLLLNYLNGFDVFVLLHAVYKCEIYLTWPEPTITLERKIASSYCGPRFS